VSGEHPWGFLLPSLPSTRWGLDTQEVVLTVGWCVFVCTHIGSFFSKKAENIYRFEVETQTGKAL
jgi:hypothetical protein